MMSRFPFAGLAKADFQFRSQVMARITNPRRRGITQMAQEFEFQLYILCDLCVKTLRLCGKKTFETASAWQSKIVNLKS